MTKMELLKDKLNDFMVRSDEMNEEDLRQVVIYMLEISNKNIDRLIEASEESVKQNESLVDYTEKLEEIILVFKDFLELKSLDKEFEFYLRGFDAS